MDSQYEYDFESELQFRAFEQSLENVLHVTHEDGKECFPGVSESINILATDMLDRAQRIRHGNRDSQTLSFTFHGDGELYTGIVATLWNGQLTQNVGANQGHDKERIVTMLSALAVDFEAMHPENVIDEIDVESHEEQEA